MSDAKRPVGRNAPCPCGSGRKYKACCMGKAEAGPAAARSAVAAPETSRRLQDANLLHREGNPAAARAIYEEVLASEPEHRGALRGLGRLMSDLGRPDLGVRFLRRAIAAGDDDPRIRVELAHQLIGAGHAREAVTAAEQALGLDGTNVPAMVALANAHERLTELDRAREVAEQALAAAPDDDSVAVLAARLMRRTRAPEKARDLLERAVARATRPAVLASAWNELGFVLERLGEYDDAFDAFSRSGEAQSRTPAAERIDAGIQPRRIEHYRVGLTRDLIRQAATPDQSSGRPRLAFLVGFPRSGTTMTEQILDAHPEVVTSDEQPWLYEVGKDLAKVGGNAADVPRLLSRLDPDRVGALRAAYWREVDATMTLPPGTSVLVDKLPLNIVDLGLLNVLFPDARVIVALRDPRDVCLSCFQQAFELNESMIHFVALDRAAAFYAQVMGLWVHLRGTITLPWIEVRYEDTVTDLPGQARRLLEHLGVAWDDAVLAFHARGRERSIKTPSFEAVTEPVHTRAIGRWRNYAKHFEAVLPVLAGFVEEFGYGDASGTGTVPISVQ